MVQYTRPASIYCAKALVHARKPTASVAVRFQGMGLCIRYRCDRNSSAAVVKEIDPKQCAHDQGALMNLGDEIDGEVIDVWVQGIRPQKFGLVGGYSGRHKAQSLQTNTETYAALIQAFAHIENARQNRLSDS